MTSLVDILSDEWVERPRKSPPPPRGGEIASIYVLHDGDRLSLPTPIATQEQVRQAFDKRRAHGTRAFAAALAEALDIPYFLNLRLARVSLDIDIPPGVDRSGQNRAIGAPVAPLLSYEELRNLLNTYYRASLKAIAEVRSQSRLWICILGRHDNQKNARILWRTLPDSDRDFIDPLVPPQVYAELIDSSLVAALLNTPDSVDTIEDGPYLKPTSLAVRGASFDWMSFLNASLEHHGAERPEIWSNFSQQLWHALLDTSRRATETWAIHQYIHHQLETPAIENHRYRSIADIYHRLRFWCQERNAELITRYKHWYQRKEGFVLEIPTHASETSHRAWAQHIAQVLITHKQSRDQSRNP